MTDAQISVIWTAVLFFGSLLSYGVIYNRQGISDLVAQAWIGRQITKKRRKRMALLHQRRSERNVAREARNIEAIRQREQLFYSHQAVHHSGGLADG